MKKFKILYIANHGQENNDDEGSIRDGLTQLGHTVQPTPEKKAKYKVGDYEKQFDFLLCHHWHDPHLLAGFHLPKVFWCFDLIEWAEDPLVAKRSLARREWITQMTDVCDLGFCTDGDWVARDTSGRLVQLMQGADQRIAGFGQKMGGQKPLLFAGNDKGGRLRRSFVQEITYTWQGCFSHVERMYGIELADQIASSKVVLAPDFPVTDRYWSNRVYITCGFGGILLHPFCRGLAEHYKDGRDILFYKDRQHLNKLICEMITAKPERRREFRDNALKRTLEEHTYLHRVEKLIEVVEERLFT